MIDIKAMQQEYLAGVQRLKNMPIEEKIRNEESHRYGIVDDRYGCVECEVSPHNFWKYFCK